VEVSETDFIDRFPEVLKARKMTGLVDDGDPSPKLTVIPEIRLAR
jgi:hypothetical protein